MIDRGLDLPEWADNPPLDIELIHLYLQFFVELHTMRNYEMGPIPYDKILWHGRRIGYKADQLENHYYFLSEMDKEFLVITKKEMESGRNTPD